MATIETVREITPGEGDFVQIHIKGWIVVARDGFVKVGDKVIYIEVDNWVPLELLATPRPKVFRGVTGQLIKTRKIHGVMSQGVCISLPKNMETYEVGRVVTEELGILRYETPAPACLGGDPKGNFPMFIPKTDQQRIQNLTVHDEPREVTEKLEGSSMTVYHHGEETGVCSRNVNLKESATNAMWMVARKQGLFEILEGRNIALQGEIVGPKISGNHYKLDEYRFYLFDIYDIKDKSYWSPQERRVFAGHHDILHVPVLDEWTTEIIPADGPSAINPAVLREGLVFKGMKQTFKSISAEYLSKQ